MKKEFFIITQGDVYRDPGTEQLMLYYDRQRFNVIAILVGAVLIMYAILF